MTCTGCGTILDTGAQYCSSCGRTLQQTGSRSFDLGARVRAERLVRPREHRMIAGVFAGFAQRYGWDASLVRLVLILALVFGAGTPVLAYAVAWVLMPNEQYALAAQSGTRSSAGPGSMAM